MYIQLTEPVAPQYIHIAGETNIVHLLVPTTPLEYKAFLNGSALKELNSYQSALVVDIRLLEENIQRLTAKKVQLSTQASDIFPLVESGLALAAKKLQLTQLDILISEQRNELEAKTSRLIQIERYIQAISAMQHTEAALNAINPLAPVRYVDHLHTTCVNLVDIIEPATPAHKTYFQTVQKDFKCIADPIPYGNQCIVSGIHVDIQDVLLEFNEERFNKLLTAEEKAHCMAHPAFKIRCFLDVVAKATPDPTDETLIKTDAAVLLLDATPEERQALLRTPCVLTDYSGRTFHCTAFEYAYWAKDIHMCRILVSYMDEETKSQLLERITVNDNHGLGFEQHGVKHVSPHFDLTPLKTALQVYLNGFDAWSLARNWTEMTEAWLATGKAQRELPVHIVNEYCRKDRRFYPIPDFNEQTLPRDQKFTNLITRTQESWFPLRASDSGLGFDFALIRYTWTNASAIDVKDAQNDRNPIRMRHELDVMSRLDQTRTNDLMRLREDLHSPTTTPPADLGM